MQFLAYILLYPIFWLISLLPFRLLYILSDFIYILMYRIIKYRKKTVRKNIALALPHLSFEERRIIEKKFFKHMVDMFLEMAKTLSITEKEMDKRFKFTNLEVYQQAENNGKSIILMCSHYASYEWLLALNFKSKHQGVAIYKQISNPYFDRLVKKIRSKFKTDLVTTKETIATMEYNQQIGKKCTYGFAMDQSPKLHSNNYWTKFMNIEVPVHNNAEVLAKRLNMNVLALSITKIKRGYYEAKFTILSENPSEIPNFQLTDTYIQLLENQIYTAPEFYLWTHKRWKHKRE